MNISVQNKPHTSNVKPFKRTNQASNNMPVLKQATAKTHTNPLMDMTYNKLLVKTNKVSFTGLPGTGVNLAKKIEVAAQFLKDDELILVGKDLENSKKLLKDSLDSFKNVIKKIFFIQDETIEGAIAFQKKEGGHHTMTNLSEKSLIVQDTNNVPIFLKKGDTMYVESGDRVFGKEQLTLSFSQKIENAFDIKKDYIKQIDLSEKAKAAVKSINQKLLGKIEEVAGVPLKNKKITFADVGGQDEAIKELKKGIIYPLKFPSAYKNSKVNRGIILTGGPGTGKSLVAEALANEADAHFIKLNGLELESKYVGESEGNWRKLFKEAVDKQPSIIFIDEFDAVARSRTGSETSRYDDKVVNQILTLMSDIEKNGDDVFVVAATNKISSIDEAIVRSGRFGKHIPMEKPDLKGCKHILNIHTKNKPISEKVNMDELSESLHNADTSGADIQHIVNEAHQNAFERLGIYEKMENDTFVEEDIDNLKIEPEDFKKAIIDFKNQRNQ